jgi:hypothetical protein
LSGRFRVRLGAAGLLAQLPLALPALTLLAVTLVRGEGRDLDPRAVAELAEDVLYVCVDGPFGHHQAGRDVLIGQAPGD